jgi:hypothetical protein
VVDLSFARTGDETEPVAPPGRLVPDPVQVELRPRVDLLTRVGRGAAADRGGQIAEQLACSRVMTTSTPASTVMASSENTTFRIAGFPVLTSVSQALGSGEK